MSKYLVFALLATPNALCIHHKISWKSFAVQLKLHKKYFYMQKLSGPLSACFLMSLLNLLLMFTSKKTALTLRAETSWNHLETVKHQLFCSFLPYGFQTFSFRIFRWFFATLTKNLKPFPQCFCQILWNLMEYLKKK